MKPGEITVKLDATDVMERIGRATGQGARVNYECSLGCGGAYTESQYSREITPACGRCGAPLDRLDLAVIARGPA